MVHDRTGLTLMVCGIGSLSVAVLWNLHSIAWLLFSNNLIIHWEQSSGLGKSYELYEHVIGITYTNDGKLYQWLQIC